MKKLFLTVCLMMGLVAARAGDVSISALPADTSAQGVDAFVIYSNSSGTYTAKRIAFSDLKTSLAISGGTVTSVAVSVPSGLSVTGPVTTTGTIAITTSLNGIILGTGSGFSTVTLGSGLNLSGSTLSVGDLSSIYQPINSGLTAISALNTTTFGRSLLTQASASSLSSTLGLGAIAMLNEIDLTANVNGALPLANGGTGAITASAARANLGLGSAALQAVSAFAQTANNLSDLANIATARSNLGLGSAATQPSTVFTLAANNLSDLASASTARTNLGLGTAATQASTTFAQTANNLSDLASASTARTNLGLAIGTNVQAHSAALDTLAAGAPLTAGSGITITGAWPTQTIAATANVAPSFATLTDSATITLTCDSTKVSQNASVTLGGNRTLAISGAASGMTGVLIVHQDGTGSRTLALPAGSKVINAGSGAVTLTTTASAADVLSWVYDGTNYYWTVGLNFN